MVNCTNSSIDCSHRAGLGIATFCQLSHCFHLPNSSIFVTHVFVVLPTLSHAVAILMLFSPNDWVGGSQYSQPVSNDDTAQSAPMILGVLIVKRLDARPGDTVYHHGRTLVYPLGPTPVGGANNTVCEREL